MPFRDYPETENFLVISDILITDYSSIANDFLY
jgi:CDP-glycerol glycerophosphotransferase (TagB/SpsB family)